MPNDHKDQAEFDHTLTDAERDHLIRAFMTPGDDCAHNMVPAFREVESIIAARLAPLVDLLDRTERDARENNHLSRLSTWQVWEAITSLPPASTDGGE